MKLTPRCERPRGSLTSNPAVALRGPLCAVPAIRVFVVAEIELVPEATQRWTNFTCVCLVQQVAVHAEDMAVPKEAVGNVLSALSSVGAADVLEGAKDVRSLLF